MMALSFPAGEKHSALLEMAEVWDRHATI